MNALAKLSKLNWVLYVIYKSFAKISQILNMGGMERNRMWMYFLFLNFSVFSRPPGMLRYILVLKPMP